MSEWNGKPCLLCGEGVLKDSKKILSTNYRGHVFESAEKVALCDACGDGIAIHDPVSEAAWVAFMADVDVQEGRNLQRIRKRLGLTQIEASKLTGGGKNAFSRYEHGAKPMAAITNLFRLLDMQPELLDKLKTG